MRVGPINVECYAGARADETPRRFEWEGRNVEIEEILDRRHQVRLQVGRPRADYFDVRGADRLAYLLEHDLESDEWYLRSPSRVAEP